LPDTQQNQALQFTYISPVLTYSNTLPQPIEPGQIPQLHVTTYRHCPFTDRVIKSTAVKEILPHSWNYFISLPEVRERFLAPKNPNSAFTGIFQSSNDFIVRSPFNPPTVTSPTDSLHIKGDDPTEGLYIHAYKFWTSASR
jgi:hypothetical protein